MTTKAEFLEGWREFYPNNPEMIGHFEAAYDGVVNGASIDELMPSLEGIKYGDTLFDSLAEVLECIEECIQASVVASATDLPAAASA